MVKGEITLEELDEQLAAALADERELDILTRYRDRKITRARAAALLKISDRQVNRRMQERGLERVEGTRVRRDRIAAERREIRLAAAKQVDEGRISPEQAAKRAGCSVRTIYRYMSG
jgi:hypothetical protein